MIYFIMTFAILGSGSLLLMLVVLVRRRFAFTLFCKRATLMAVVWMGAAGGLHLLMAGSADFRKGLPMGLLNLDLHYACYGGVAIGELTRRAEVGSTGAADWSKTLGVLIANPWWVDDAEGAVVGENGLLIHPARRYFRHLLLVEELRATDFALWLGVDPAPLFEVPTEVEVESGGLAVLVQYGREWNAETRVAYEIAKLEIDAVRIDGEVVEFEMVEAEGVGSEAELGRFAQRVVWFIGGLPQPTAGGEVVIEIEYRLWAEPGRFRGVGPLFWRRVILVRE